MASPTLTYGLDSVDAATVELLNAILHVATQPGCTLADLTRYVAEVRERIGNTTVKQKLDTAPMGKEANHSA
jgi:hypothetical protein